MLSEHEGVASVFEWFPGLDPQLRFQAEPMEGRALAELLRRDHPVLTAVLARGHAVPEVVYPYGAPKARYEKPGDPVPWTLGIAMARLSDDPDALFDALLAMLESRPCQGLDRHYREIFDWLAARLGRSAWVERSAGSIEFVGELDAMFPDARFVYLQRDGRETALSTREYAALRVAVAMMFGLGGDDRFEQQGLAEKALSATETIDRLLETRPPVELFGRYWTQQVEAGSKALATIDPARVLEVRFEALVADPRRHLLEIRDFFELGGGDAWIERGAALVRGIPPLRFPDLSPDEQQRLDDACARAWRCNVAAPPESSDMAITHDHEMVSIYPFSDDEVDRADGERRTSASSCGATKDGWPVGVIARVRLEGRQGLADLRVAPPPRGGDPSRSACLGGGQLR